MDRGYWSYHAQVNYLLADKAGQTRRTREQEERMGL